MAQYLIEFRFQSKRIRSYIKGIIHELNKKFRVGKRKHIPHITLIGPIVTNNEKRLVSDFAKICSQTKLMKFKGKGFGTFDNNKVVFVNIVPDEKFNEFRIKLSQKLKEYCKLPAHNKRKEKEKFGYHSTLAMKLNANEFNSIKNYIKNKPAPDFTQRVMRVTLLKGGRILREYDFLQRRLLNRKQSLNKNITRRSKTLLKRFIQGNKQKSKVKPIIRKKEILSKIKSWLGLK
ncbi:MAG: 2'-5' RNA ligase family protein [Nanoarchaeota archaeon]|nr:2'-5' RNA ligase family protein [Nanoarchaeota archaeon]MBU4116355.1 2'-5' RNA ligase family protein [Nanoarchaeota archaeon]